MSIARSTHTAHRTTFGPRRNASAATRARYVAESILDRERRGDSWTLEEFVPAAKAEQRQLVLTTLEALRAAQAA